MANRVFQNVVYQMKDVSVSIKRAAAVKPVPVMVF